MSSAAAVFSSPNEASSSTSTLVIPPMAITHEPRSSSTEQPMMNPTDESFGYTLAMSSTSESRHDRRLSSADSDIAPPPYAEPPAYELRQTEPATLAMYLFKFGFLFPPFWIMGAFILLSPLQAPDASSSSPSSSSSTPSAWFPDKTEAERAHIIANLRKTEVKWARRCLIAILALLLLAVVAGVTIWAVLRA